MVKENERLDILKAYIGLIKENKGKNENELLIRTLGILQEGADKNVYQKKRI